MIKPLSNYAQAKKLKVILYFIERVFKRFVVDLCPYSALAPIRLAIYLFPFSTTNAPALHLRVALMMVNYHVENSHQSDIIK